MTELTKEQKELLTEIMNDRYSVGAFSGMVFNALVTSDIPFTTENIDMVLMAALDTRLRLKELSQ